MSSAEFGATAIAAPIALGAPRRPKGLFTTLASRLTAWVFASSFGIVLAASGLLYWATLHALQWVDDQVLQQRMEAARSWLDATSPDVAALDHEVSENITPPRQIFIRVIDKERSIYIESPNMNVNAPETLFPDANAQRLGERVSLTIQNGAGTTFRAQVARLGVGEPSEDHNAIIQVAVDTSLDEEAIASFRWLLAAVLGASLPICALLAWRISRRELAPLRRVTDAAQKMSSMTLDRRLLLDGLPDELHELGDEFNRMLGRLETAYAGLRHYADNAAHELRGPVNKMLLEAEVALQRDRNEQTYREALEANADEARQLARIVDSILFLARAENAAMAIDRKPMELFPFLEAIREFFEASADEANIRLTVVCDPQLTLSADRVLLQRAVSNLVGNALCHSTVGDSITITARREGERVAIEVADCGEGIPAAEQAHVFDRFYRVDTARSTNSRIGLGLAITKSIVDLHRGTVELDSILGKGTTVRLLFDESQAHVPH
jgi:two-component system heavy metal sensor histidine kinase CusS